MNRQAWRRALLGLALALLVAAPVLAQAQPGDAPPSTGAPAQAAAPSGPRLSSTAHSINLDGGALHYTATAGVQPLRDAGGKIAADMFFVAYTKQGVPDPSKRPIAFVFNGGPGASSVLLHLGAVGPKRIRLADNGTLVSAPPEWVDNTHTWLAFTDLVLIDAIGTGFSRAAPAVPAVQFYQVKGDASSFAQFIRLYLAANNRQRSPTLLAGESYGGTRAVILARLLQRDFGIAVKGLILISPVIDFETLNAQYGNPARSTDLAFALDVPSYAATAWHYHKLRPELQANFQGLLREVERWSINEYLPALVQGDALPEDEQARIAGALSQYAGIPETVVRANHLRLLPSAFRRELLRDRQLELGQMDGRIAYDPRAARGFGTEAVAAAFGTVFTDYARSELRYRADQPYDALSETVVRSWDWGANGPSGVLNVLDDLRQAMRQDPAMKVLVARGYYDLDVPFYGTDYALNQLHLGAALDANVTRTYYDSGHMVYTSEATLAQLTADARVLVAGAAAAVRR